jgi:hypothetical protein
MLTEITRFPAGSGRRDAGPRPAAIRQHPRDDNR